MSSVESIYRYPIKGFPGERLESAALVRNEGIAGDRSIAIGDGKLPVNEEGAWTPCQAFHRMSTRPDLTTFQVDRKQNGLKLIAPDGMIQNIDETKSHFDTMSSKFGGPTLIHRARNNRGFWDHQDAAISIINLATIEAIGKILNCTIDPLRFRANIYVRAEPWSEFQWLGQKIELGNAQLNIIRPIDRCKTTSVDVNTGEMTVNMPAMLMRLFGHMFCGVYASVCRSGTIINGAKISRKDQTCFDNVAAASVMKTAPSLPDWPRPATISKISDEAEGICSLWIKDSLEKFGSLKSFKAGQYVRLHNISDQSVWRSYTVSAVKDGALRITVKRDKGVGSQAVHSFKEGEQITITGPFGTATLDAKSDAVHRISAGIGITPTFAKLTELAQKGYESPALVTHVARSKSELALWDDVLATKSKLAKAVFSLHLTKENAGVPNAISGRPELVSIAHGIRECGADVHVCGPTGFVDSVLTALKQAKVPENKIFIDVFSTPDVQTEMRPIPSSAPIKVTLTKSNITDYWKPEDGTLLEFAESRGALIPSHCRAGLCKTCKCEVVEGSATRLIGELGNDLETTLLCSSIPSETLTLDV